MEHYNAVIEVLELGINYIRLLQESKNARKKFRRWWSKPHIRYNYFTGYGAYQRIFRYFKLNDEEEFIRFTRMNVQAFMYIFDLVEDRLSKYSWRVPLPAELRLSITLNYLAYGDSVMKNAWFHSTGLSTLYKIIPEVCNVLCDTVAPIFLAFPSIEEFLVISNKFKTDLFFPNCIGALDGRHCPIRKPDNSGSLFWNYKKFFSIVLMACCDSNKRFIWMNVGDYGSYNDAGIFAFSDLGQALANATINLPPPAFLPGTEIQSPHFLIGDGGFPIKKYLMKSYARNNNMAVPRQIFNYRLSHARSVIENAFGLLSKVWSINQHPLGWKINSCRKIIMSTVCLHNFLLDFTNNVINRPYDIDEVTDIHNMVPNNEIINEGEVNGLNAITLRRNLTDYFVSPIGSVPFQYDRI